MKTLVFPLLTALALAGCQKETAEPEQVPTDIQAVFEADFSLQHQQQAFLPSSTQPELTVRLDDLDYTFCPEGVYCVVGPSAWPKLSVTDAQGQTQQVDMPWSNPRRIPNPTWLDTTSVRANNRRYVLTYQRWETVKPLGLREYPGKSHFALWFRVNRIGN